MAGLRWYEGVADELAGARYVLDVESCRRVVDESCSGREGRVPTNVLEALGAAAETRFDVVIVMAGYNEDGTRFDERVRFVGQAADQLGIDHKLWMRFTTPDPTASVVDTRPHNDALDLLAGDGTSGWTIVDWPAYADSRSGVFEPDHIHLTRTGAIDLAGFISQVVVAATDPGCRERSTAAPCTAIEFVRSVPLATG